MSVRTAPSGAAAPASRGAPVELVCPVDGAPLRPEDGGGAYECPRCRGRHPVENGVVRFLEESDRFYEGRYLYTVRYVPRSERWIHAWPLWLMTCGYVSTVRRHVPERSVVLELGCASGVAYFASRYRVVGLDLSLSSLERVAELYDACLQADATRCVPLPDASVDAVISSFVWEHIPPEEKPRALAELSRVLRPGGKLVFLYDVESDNPVYRHLRRRDPALYREVFIDREGHLGWQTPEENREIFGAAGFRVVEHRGKEKLFFSPWMYDKVRQWDGGVRRLAGLFLRFAGGPQFQAYNAFVRSFDETVGRVLPTRFARVMVTVCEKPAPSASDSW